MPPTHFVKCETRRDVAQLVDDYNKNLTVEAVVPDAYEMLEVVTSMTQDEVVDPLCVGGEGFSNNLPWIWQAWKDDYLFVLRVQDGEKELSCQDAKSGGQLLVPPCSHKIIVPAFLGAFGDNEGKLISLLWVRSDLRRLGIGTRLVEECIQNHEVHGAHDILTQSKGFWDKIDFADLMSFR